jgi:hypothetical protein
MEKYRLNPVYRDIELHFNYLFNYGYKIRKLNALPLADWEIIFESSENCIIIYSDRGDFDVAFAPLNSTLRNQIGIRGMIYYLTNGKNFIGKYKSTTFNSRKNRFKILALLLKQYLDQITPYFGKDFDNYKQELIQAGKKYNDVFIEKYIPKREHKIGD